MQLESFGVDLEALQRPATSRIFRAWVEDWEKEILLTNDCVVEARLLEKYKNLVFFDPDDQVTYTVVEDNLEFHRRNKRKGIAGGWALIGADEDDNEVGFEINKMVIGLISETAQAPGVELIFRELEDSDELDEEAC